jgi:hypothetical protein
MLIRRLKVIVPTLQVLLLVSVAVWHHIIEKRFINQPDFIAQYASTPIHILLKLNFPLLAVWSLVVFPLDYALSKSYLNLPGETPSMVIVLVFDLALLASVAALWYFVVVEIQMRRYGNSLIRFSGRRAELLKIVILVVAGVGAIAYACWDGHRLLELGQLNRHALYWSSMVDAAVGGLFLAIWAVVLIWMAVQDFVVRFQPRRGGS